MKDFCKILGFLLLSEILSLFLDLTLSFSSHTLLRLLTGLCTLGILTGLCAQGGVLYGSEEKKKKRPVSKIKPFFLSLTAILPGQICWMLLLCSRTGVLPDDFYRIYKLLCAPLLAVCNLFYDGILTSGIPVWELAVLEILTLFPGAAVWAGYAAARKQF